MGGLCGSTDMSLIFVGDNSTDYIELGSYECRMRCLAAAGCVGFNLAINYDKCYLKEGTLDLDTCDAPRIDWDMYKLCK